MKDYRSALAGGEYYGKVACLSIVFWTNHCAALRPSTIEVSGRSGNDSI